VLFFSPFINPYRVMMEKDDFLSKTESIEWGDPLTSDEINNYILSYSPSQNTYKINNITTEVLIIIGAQDKLVSNNDVLVWHENLVKKRAKAFIYVNENAGHGGITTTDERLFSNILSHFLYKINRC
ncbi:MAG: prolyl oligopeptidase family serine peptidase, partial [Lactobacillaceae bacterium]